MRSERFRAGFAKQGIALSEPKDEAARNKTIELIAELQRGREKGAAVRLGRIVRASWGFQEEPVVCLACTELQLAFPAFKAQPSFKYGGVIYVNTAAAHIATLLKYVGIPSERKGPAPTKSGPVAKGEYSVVGAAARTGGAAAAGADAAARMAAAARAATAANAAARMRCSSGTEGTTAGATRRRETSDVWGIEGGRSAEGAESDARPRVWGTEAGYARR
jgi:hypothetical protein